MGAREEALFKELNRQYWRGRLPTYAVRRVPARTAAKVLCGWGVCDHGRRRIFLSSALGGERLREVLLHEMIHIRYPEEEHGPRFRRELARLIGLGERALQKHLDECEMMEGSYRDEWPTMESLLADIRGNLEVLAEEEARRRWWSIYREMQDFPEWRAWNLAWDRHWRRKGFRNEPPPSLIAWMQDEWKSVSRKARRGGAR